MTATPLDAALKYARELGWKVFPCGWTGERRKKPLTTHGFHEATDDEQQIRQWWTAAPIALIGVAAGLASNDGILDVDVKDPSKYGPDTLEELGVSIPTTWIVHTPTAGWHYHFNPTGRHLPSTTHKLGPGLDTRFEGGYFIAPSPGSGYYWDHHCHPGTLPTAAPAPDWLIPKPPPPTQHTKPLHPARGLSPFADAAIANACERIRTAPNGQQSTTLRKFAYHIGGLAGAGAIPPVFAKAALADAATGMPNYNPNDLWTNKEITRVVNDCFNAGLAKPYPTDRRR